MHTTKSKGKRKMQSDMDMFTDPLAIDAEYSIVACALRRKKLDAIVQVLTPDDFADSKCKKAWELFGCLHEQGKSTSYVEMEIAFGKEEAKAIDFKARSTSADFGDIQNHIQRVSDASFRRRVMSKAMSIWDMARNPSTSQMDIIDALSVSDVLPKSSRQPVNGAEIMDELLTFLLTPPDREHFEIIPTYIEGLDKKLTGLIRGLLTIISGVPGAGKSTVASQIAINCAMHGHRVTWYSIEDKARYAVMKCLSAMSGEKYNDMFRRQLSAHSVCDLGRFRHNFENLWIEDRAEQSAYGIRQSAIQQQKKNGLDLILVDHLQEMVDESREYESTNREMKTLTNLAKELNVPLVLICQPNRNASKREDKRLTMQDLRGSGVIEAKARQIILLYREHKGTDNDFSIEANVEKNTHGETGREVLNVDFSTMRVW
jgi:replicative DNA helicase